MKRFFKFFTITAAAIIMMSGTAFAGSWKQDQSGWYWLEDNGSYPVSTWKWLDANQDGVAECYYFDMRGYLVTNRTTPDGYQVNADGCWIVNNRAQTQTTGLSANQNVQLYNQAMEKTSSLDNYNATATLKMNFAMQDFEMNADATMDMKVKDQFSGNMKYILNMKMNMLGQTIDTTTFYTDGYYYMDMYDNKIKVPMPMDEMVKTSLNASDLLQDSDYLQDLQIADDGQGNKVLTYNISADSFNSILGQLLQSMGQTIDSDIKIREFHGSAKINAEGYCYKTSMVMKYVMVIEGQSITGDIMIDLDYINPGQNVYFDLPSTDGYVEY